MYTASGVIKFKTESADLVILGVTFDVKMIFERYLHFITRAAALSLGIMRN